MIIAAAALVVFASACSRSGPTLAESTARGTALQTFEVTVYRPTGGTVTSADGQITCGTTGSTCTATYAWSDTVALTATADPGQMFGSWAGDCDGRTLDANGKYTCFLGTVPYGADKYVVAVFGDPGQAMHGNWVPSPPTKPTVHGYEFRNFIQFRNAGGSGDYFDCTYCHGPDYGGRGIAPSCNQCHANSGHAEWQSECNFCHGAPPPPLAQNPPHTATHPVTGSSDPVSCHGCHLDTVDVNGQIIPASAGGKHMNGTIEAQGHAQVFDPVQHGPMFLDALAAAASVPGAAPSCAGCHSSDAGATYAVAIVPADPTLNPNGYASCDACHAGNGWSSYWQSNCTFCHGTRIQSGMPTPVDVAPPDAILQRLTGVEQPARTGWHELHLSNNQFAPSPNYNCSGCHTVPATLGQAGHVTADRRAVVEINASVFPGLTQTDIDQLPNPLGTYDPSTGSCTVYCHGSTMAADMYAPKIAVVWTKDPALQTPIFSCTGCHGSPPLSGSTVVGHTYPPTVPATPTSTQYCGTAGCTNHWYHAIAQTQFGYDSCSNCHYGSAQTTSAYAGIHADGRKDIVPSGTNTGTKPVTFTWDPVTQTCSNTSCHTKSGTTATQSW